ncbi:hypothetical protein LCGC14_1206490 [marine sediment metagenome]|uniref:Uncharacterized protein n=1 Tax=marine sediment metagenome TaxID=412755 RepID=A0A0F9LJN8_9ZZZZ
MIANNYIQADLIAAMKEDAPIVTEIGDEQGRIKEQQWAGTGFTYPAVRLRLNRQVPEGKSGCDHNRLSFSVLVFTEGGSSKEADLIAGLVNDLFAGDENGDGKFFHGETQAGKEWTSTLRSTGLDSAIRTGEKLWQAFANFSCIVRRAS